MGIGLVSGGGGVIAVPFDALMSGGLVGNSGALFVSVLPLSAVSLGLRQPWIRRATNAITLRLMEKYTAYLSRVRALFFCSKKEPWGRNGLGLFIYLARWRPFSNEV